MRVISFAVGCVCDPWVRSSATRMGSRTLAVAAVILVAGAVPAAGGSADLERALQITPEPDSRYQELRVSRKRQSTFGALGDERPGACRERETTPARSGHPPVTEPTERRR